MCVCVEYIERGESVRKNKEQRLIDMHERKRQKEEKKRHNMRERENENRYKKALYEDRNKEMVKKSRRKACRVMMVIIRI
jgi:hypothetical protein